MEKSSIKAIERNTVRVFNIDNEADELAFKYGYNFTDRYEEAFKLFNLPFKYAEWRKWGMIRQQREINEVRKQFEVA